VEVRKTSLKGKADDTKKNDQKQLKPGKKSLQLFLYCIKPYPWCLSPDSISDGLTNYAFFFAKCI
jgi:hypothetical protein